MKALLICEYRQGKLLDSTYELLAFTSQLGVECDMLLIGDECEAPAFNGTVYLADAGIFGEYNPDIHKQIILNVLKRSQFNYIIFSHSSYGWDLAPRVATSLKSAQISEIVGILDGKFEVACFNAKMRRSVLTSTQQVVLTLQAGAFNYKGQLHGNPKIEKISIEDRVSNIKFIGYEEAAKKGVDLTKAEVIVSAGRGIGKKENVQTISALAEALGAEVGATRPVVDSGWIEHSNQVGTTGQIVSPKLYVACGISGAIHHIAGMKKSDFIIAINKDIDAPIGEVADVLVVADVLQFVPALTALLIK